MTRLEKTCIASRGPVPKPVRSSRDYGFDRRGLGLVKRKIMDKTNRMLGKQLLQTDHFQRFLLYRTIIVGRLLKSSCRKNSSNQEWIPMADEKVHKSWLI